MEFYANGEKIRKEEVLEKSRACEISVSYDNGKTIFSTYRDVKLLKMLMNEGLIEFSYLPWDKSFLFKHVAKSSTEVSVEVLDYLAAVAHMRKIKLDCDEALLFVNHPSVLKWLLKKGAKCKYIYGWGESSLEHFMRKKRDNEPYADEMIRLLREFNAMDYEFLKRLKEPNSSRKRWPAELFSHFYDIIVYFDKHEIRYKGISIAALPLDRDVYISFDNGYSKHSLLRDVKAMGRAFKEGVLEFGVIPKAADFPFKRIITSKVEVSPYVLDVLLREANKAGVELDLENLAEMAGHESVKSWFEKKLEKGEIK